MISSRLFRTLSLTALFTFVSSSATYSQTKAEQIDRLLSLYNEYGFFNGSVLVAENGVPIYKNGFGMANFEWDIANSPNTGSGQSPNNSPRR